MGSKGRTAIRWLIVGTNNNGTVTALTVEDKAILETGKLLEDTTYVALSAEALEPYYFHYTSSSTNDINTNDYYISSIRTWIRANFTFETDYALNNDLISASIKSRSIKELYADIDEKDPVTSGKSIIADSNTESDKFWLLSEAEIYTLFENDKTISNYASASITTKDSSSCWWWLRSPSSYTKGARYVSSDGTIYSSDDANDNTGALRPAFQF